MFWKKSLLARLVGYYLVLALVGVAVVGAVAYSLARRALTASVAERLDAVATVKEDQLVRWVDDERQDVIFMAQLPELRAQAEALLAAVEEDAAYRAAHEALSSYFYARLANKRDWQQVFLLSRLGGKIVVSTQRSQEGQYRLVDRYFVEGQRETFVQNVYASPVTGKPTLTIAAPLAGSSGQAAGVLATHLHLDRVDRILSERSGLGASGEAYLVDRVNVFVSSERYGRQDFPRGVHTPGIDAAVRGESGSGLYRNYAGVPVVGVYRWIPEREVALLVEIAQAEAFAPAERLATTILLVGLISSAVLAAAIFLLARQITRPILAVARAADRIAGGDLAHRTPVTGQDEVGTLARAFNRMTEQLHAVYEGLEDQVKARTTELVRANALLHEADERRRHELARARRIQERLLPSSAVGWPGRLAVAWRFRPAVETSGDFIDVFEFGGELNGANGTGGLLANPTMPSLQIAVGDVAGKGMAAALVTALVRSSLRSLRSLSPARTARAVSQQLHADVGGQNFAACALAVISARPSAEDDSVSMRLTNAGQMPVLLCRAGAVLELDSPGDRFPMGAVDSPCYEDLRVDLLPGDVVVFCSDGLAEAPARGSEPRGEYFGFERFNESAARWAASGVDARGVADGIWSEVLCWTTEDSHHDDMALLVVRVLP